MTRKRYLPLVAGCFGFLFLLFHILEIDSYARMGRGGSFGSRGSRSYSSPSRSTTTSPSRSYQSPSSQPSQPGSGLFGGSSLLRGMAGGIAGGFLGSMLFRGLGFGAGGGFGGGGIGLFEILLLAVILYMIYRFVKRRRERALEAPAYYQGAAAAAGPSYQPSVDNYAPQEAPASDVESGLRYIAQMDPSFDQGRFRDTCMDMFFKLQGAWGVRDLTPIRGLVTDEVYRTIQGDADRLKAERKINKLDNIAVRSTDIVEAWQESGRDYITVRFYANLVDYTVDEDTGQVSSGSKTEPVKFEEYWTFTRPVGNNPWQLSAINQSE